MHHAYTGNPNLPVVKPDWAGTPLNPQGRFTNHLEPYDIRFADIWKWQTGPRPDKAAKRADTFRLDVRRGDEFLRTDRDCIVWLGHASFFVRLGGTSMLIDPVFGAPSVLMKRFAELPLRPDALQQLDYILLSHDHRDHADEKSIKTLAALNPNTRYLTGLQNGALLKGWTGSKNIQEAGWYQQFDTTGSGLEIVYTPARHWCRRYLTDTNIRLWGGFMIRGNGRTLYFAGDSGYGAHFSEIAATFPRIDIALLGIGAYKPEWFMAPSHTSPKGALDAFRDLGATTMLPMHYGTFDLSDESLGDPPRTLQTLVQQEKMENQVRMQAVGDVWWL